MEASSLAAQLLAGLEAASANADNDAQLSLEWARLESGAILGRNGHVDALQLAFGAAAAPQAPSIAAAIAAHAELHSEWGTHVGKSAQAAQAFVPRQFVLGHAPHIAGKASSRRSPLYKYLVSMLNDEGGSAHWQVCICSLPSMHVALLSF
jgi:hypothetical protein